MNNKTLAAIAVLCVSQGSAFAESFASCTIYNKDPFALISRDTGATSCFAEAPPWTRSRAELVQSGPLNYGATVSTNAPVDEPDFPWASSAEAFNRTREDFYFAGAPAHSRLRIFWSLNLGGVENYVDFALGSKKFIEFEQIETSDFQFFPGQPVIVRTSMRQYCDSGTVCSGGSSLVMHGMDLVGGPAGESLIGYRFRFGSGITPQMNSGDDIFFPGGTFDRGLPEPSSVVLTGGALLLGVARLLLRHAV